MNNDQNHMDDYFKKHLDGFESDTSANLWRKLSWLLFLKKFGVWIGTGAVLSAIVLTYFFIMPSVNNNPLEMTSNKHGGIEPTVISDKTQEVDFYNNEEKNNFKNESDTKLVDSENKEFQNPEESKIKTSPETSKIAPTIKPQIRIEQLNSIRPSESKSSELATSNNLEYFKNAISMLPNLSQNQITLGSNQFKTFQINERNNSTNLIDAFEDDETDPKPIRSNKWSLDLFVNPTYNIQSLKAKDDFEDHCQYRKDSEEPAFSVGLGAEVKYSIKNFFLQTGLNYSNYNQKYQYNTTNFDLEGGILVTYDTTWIWVIDPPYIYPYPASVDSALIVVLESETISVAGTNSYRYLEIPMLIGYQSKFKKLNIEIGAGVSYGFILSANGKLPVTTNDKFIDLDQQTGNMNNNFNFLLYLGLEYRMQENWSIIVKPNYKQNLNTTFKSDFPVKQKFITFGLAFGVRINL